MTSIPSSRISRFLTTLAGLFFASTATAQSSGDPNPTPPADAAQLAKQLSNPVASLISVPFQSNWEFQVGPDNDTRFLLNFQPVMPFSLNEKWNLIGRVIVPVLSQPPLVPGAETSFGLGDLLLSGFFSPKKTEPFIWGAGPVLLMPISSDPFLGTEKWGLGPTAVALKQTGAWTYGALVNHVWSFSGDDDRTDVNQTYLQPFLARSSANGLTLTLSSESTANWEAESGKEWTVPVILNLSKVTRLGKRPVSLGIGAGYYVETPDDQPEWKLRTNFTLLYPIR